MTTNEVVKQLAKRMQISQRAARGRLRQKLSFLSNLLVQKKSIEFPDFGSIRIETTDKHRQYIPGKQANCIVPERKRAVFTMSERLRRWITGGGRSKRS